MGPTLRKRDDESDVVMAEALRLREQFGDIDALYVDTDGNVRPKRARLSKSGGLKNGE